MRRPLFGAITAGRGARVAMTTPHARLVEGTRLVARAKARGLAPRSPLPIRREQAPE